MAQVLDQLVDQLSQDNVLLLLLLLAVLASDLLLDLLLQLVVDEVSQLHQLWHALVLLLWELNLLEEHDVLLQLLQLLLGPLADEGLLLNVSQLLNELLDPLLGQRLLDLLLDDASDGRWDDWYAADGLGLDAVDDWDAAEGWLIDAAARLLLELLSQDSLVLAQLLLQLLDLLNLGRLQVDLLLLLLELDWLLLLELDWLLLLLLELLSKSLLHLLVDLLVSQVAVDLALLVLNVSQVQLGLELLDDLLQMLLLVLQGLLLLGLLLEDLRLLSGPQLAASGAHDVQ